MNLLIPQLRNSVSLFSETLPEYKEDVIDILGKFDVGEKTINKVSEYLDNFTKVITDYIKGNSKDVLSITTEVATSIISIVSKGIISLVFAIYIIAQKETLKRQVDKLMKAYLKPRVSDKIADIATMSNKTFSNFVTGQCLEAIIFGALCFIGMLVLRLPYASTISVVIGFTALIPVFGSIIGTALGAFLILMISPVKAIIFVVFIIVLQQLEGNLIYPKVVGKSIGLPGMWVLFSVTIGASVAGLWGMLVATPLFSVLYSIFFFFINDRINKILLFFNVVDNFAFSFIKSFYITMAIILDEPLFIIFVSVWHNLNLILSGIIDSLAWIPSCTITSRLLPNISLFQIPLSFSFLVK